MNIMHSSEIKLDLAFSDGMFCCLSWQVFASRQINLLTAQAWSSSSKQLEEKVWIEFKY